MYFRAGQARDLFSVKLHLTLLTSSQQSDLQHFFSCLKSLPLYPVARSGTQMETLVALNKARRNDRCGVGYFTILLFHFGHKSPSLLLPVLRASHYYQRKVRRIYDIENCLGLD